MLLQSEIKIGMLYTRADIHLLDPKDDYLFILEEIQETLAVLKSLGNGDNRVCLNISWLQTIESAMLRLDFIEDGYSATGDREIKKLEEEIKFLQKVRNKLRELNINIIQENKNAELTSVAVGNLIEENRKLRAKIEKLFREKREMEIKDNLALLLKKPLDEKRVNPSRYSRRAEDIEFD